MTNRVNPETRRGIRWPATPLAWLALALLAPPAVAAGFLYGALGPLVWMLWLFW